ncbi:tyrosine-type recombinase/integrase [Patescibacteria group bacterium]|nr:tyrosine-type recombinase/integrase [Patescibacteria group bacterium]
MDNYLLPSLIERFVNHIRNQGKSNFTIVAYKKDLEQFTGYLTSQEKTDIREVDKDNVNGFIEKLLKDNYTKKSASRKLNSIRTFFRFLKNDGVINQNPSLDVTHPKYVQGEPRILTKLEYRALRDYAKNDPRTYAIIELLLQTGLRIGELAILKMIDIDRDALRVPSYGKNPGRDIPINRAVKNAVNNYLKTRDEGKSEFLFITRTGHPLLIRNIRQIISRCFREVGIENATVNDLRNTFIAHQLINGASVEYIAKIVGHRRLSSTERFLNLVKNKSEKKERLGEL